MAYKAPVHRSVQKEVSVKELVCTEPWPQSHPTPLGGSEPHLICISNALVAEWKQISAGLRLWKAWNQKDWWLLQLRMCSVWGYACMHCNSAQTWENQQHVSINKTTFYDQTASPNRTWWFAALQTRPSSLKQMVQWCIIRPQSRCLCYTLESILLKEGRLLLLCRCVAQMQCNIDGVQ